MPYTTGDDRAYLLFVVVEVVLVWVVGCGSAGLKENLETRIFRASNIECVFTEARARARASSGLAPLPRPGYGRGSSVILDSSTRLWYN